MMQSSLQHQGNRKNAWRRIENMDKQLLETLKQITPEEQEILDGNTNVKRELYTSVRNFIIDSGKLLSKGKLIEVRAHTRFIHFSRHSHNYVEMVYMCSGTTTHIINDSKKLHLPREIFCFWVRMPHRRSCPPGRMTLP